MLVAEWDGWCGPCAEERPLVLTRAGGTGLLSRWPSASGTEALTLTCRLCGVGVPVPAEEDETDVLPDADSGDEGRADPDGLARTA